MWEKKVKGWTERFSSCLASFSAYVVHFENIKKCYFSNVSPQVLLGYPRGIHMPGSFIKLSFLSYCLLPLKTFTCPSHVVILGNCPSL